MLEGGIDFADAHVWFERFAPFDLSLEESDTTRWSTRMRCGGVWADGSSMIDGFPCIYEGEA